MKSIIQSMLEEIYMRALEISRNNGQMVGQKKDYYITLEQLEGIVKSFQD